MQPRAHDGSAGPAAEVERLTGENQTLAQELEAVREELARFVYVASHDLRAPLRAIKSLSEWIAEDLGSQCSDETREHLVLLRARVERMDAYLLALLEYSRVGRMPVAVERVDLGELLQHVIAEVAPPATMHVDVVMVEDVEPFDAPRAALERVLFHLVQNGVLHHDRPEGRVLVRVTRADDTLRVEVRDDGPGIPLKHRDKALELFQTLQRRDDAGGCGMGLPLARKIVSTHGGSLELLGEERGTIVCFTWPLAR